MTPDGTGNGNVLDCSNNMEAERSLIMYCTHYIKIIPFQKEKKMNGGNTNINACFLFWQIPRKCFNAFESTYNRRAHIRNQRDEEGIREKIAEFLTNHNILIS